MVVGLTLAQGCHGIGRSGRHDVVCAVTLAAMVVAAGTMAGRVEQVPSSHESAPEWMAGSNLLWDVPS